MCRSLTCAGQIPFQVTYTDCGHYSYSDGEIIREGPVGDQGDGAYSVGVSFSKQLQHIMISSEIPMNIIRCRL